MLRSPFGARTPHFKRTSPFQVALRYKAAYGVVRSGKWWEIEPSKEVHLREQGSNGRITLTIYGAEHSARSGRYLCSGHGRGVGEDGQCPPNQPLGGRKKRTRKVGKPMRNQGRVKEDVACSAGVLARKRGNGNISTNVDSIQINHWR